MSTIVYPSAANFLASTWTLVTSGHVASIVCSERVRALACTRRGDPVGREHDRGTLGNLGLGFDEHGSPGAQLLDHVLVVDDLLAHVDRGAVQLERALDRLHGAVDAGAVATRRGQQQLFGPVSHRETV